MGTLNRVKWDQEDGRRYNGYQRFGFTSDHVVPTKFDMCAGQFSMATTQIGWRVGPDVPNLDLPHRIETLSYAAAPAARNKAWNDFVESVRTAPASLGQAVAEWQQTSKMVGNRLTTSLKAFKALRKGNFKGFLETLNIGPKRKHKNLFRNEVNRASNLWLEYSFGWSPLFRDVYDGLHALGSPVPTGICTGKGGESYTYTDSQGTKLTGFMVVRIGATVFISNPNEYALSQMGLANPAAVAWEVVPWSFMVDWVFDVSTSLNAFTDLMGCSVGHPYTTIFGKASGSWGYRNSWGPQAVDIPGKVVAMSRRPELPLILPNVSFRANIGSSLKRAANAASLLGQMLTK